MADELQQSGKGDALARGRFLPYLVLRDVLDEATVERLLEYAVSNQTEFKPTALRAKVVNRSFRVSMRLPELGDFKQRIETRILGLLPRLIAELRISPINAPKLEFELVAHGDGAFYKRHIDTQTGDDPDKKKIRVLSCVYYFNAEPKAFTGGALRLHSIGGNTDENIVDIEPTRNTLLVFPSWAPHEVLPVSCPSRRFIDSRFAINCWVRGERPGTT